MFRVGKLTVSLVIMSYNEKNLLRREHAISLLHINIRIIYRNINIKKRGRSMRPLLMIMITDDYLDLSGRYTLEADRFPVSLVSLAPLRLETASTT